MTITMEGKKIRVQWTEKVRTVTTSRGVTYTRTNAKREKLFSEFLDSAARKFANELKNDSNCYGISIDTVNVGCIRI